jgi:Caspase domain
LLAELPYNQRQRLCSRRASHFKKIDIGVRCDHRTGKMNTSTPTGATIVGTLAARSVIAQPSLGPRAAVVIGINKTRNLPVLSAAASGAREVARWLQGEGFEVNQFIDDDGKAVELSSIFHAVKNLVDRGTLEQLVVYFSGHGCMPRLYTEFWLLSEVSYNPNEAISLKENVELARLSSAIPNVVFISDACRSTLASFGFTVQGGVIFPNEGPSHVHTEIDQFFAARPGDSAFELPVDASASIFEGIYTASFLEAFKHPDNTMVEMWQGGARVIPNRKLRDFLVREVRRRAGRRTMRQEPDSIVESEAFIGRVSSEAPQDLPPPSSVVADATMHDFASLELNKAGAGTLDEAAAGIRLEYPPRPGAYGFDRGWVPDVQSFLITRNGFGFYDWNFIQASEMRNISSGFVVVGNEPVTLAAATRGIHIDLSAPDDHPGEARIVRADLGRETAGSVILRFAGGSGAVVATLKDYVGVIKVEEGRVVYVSYYPSRNSPRWPDYKREHNRIDGLLARVATAAYYGVFRIEGTKDERPQRAAKLADRIRVGKGIDPTLSLYAAYAYADADLIDSVRSVRNAMRDDLDADFYDLAMLSQEGLDNRAVPFCPMLAQGWDQLRVRGIHLSPDVEQVRNYVLPALWTTFDPEGVDILVAALRAGRLR